MRSTRIRTVDHTVVTIPNGALSSNVIENFAHRKKFKFTAIIGLRYDTTPEQMRDILVKLRSLLHEHPKVYKDPARIRLQELGASSLNLDLFAYIHATDFEDFLEIREGILLQIMEVVNDSATDFSFPSQTLYLARDKGMGRDGQDMRREEAFRSL